MRHADGKSAWQDGIMPRAATVAIDLPHVWREDMPVAARRSCRFLGNVYYEVLKRAVTGLSSESSRPASNTSEGKHIRKWQNSDFRPPGGYGSQKVNT
ncbi:hypothetical protein [Brucella sp. IR073]|uniref:hypothetical protein n=1 Tax=unclassified Brucella TaxID=2632610 RepID=UPI003B9843D4